MARYRRLMNAALALHVEQAGDLAVIREELVLDGQAPGRQARELAIGTLYRLFRELLGPSWRPYSVEFTHDRPPDLREHRRLFGLEIRFESEFNGIVCACADLDRPNPSADPAMARYAQQFLETLAVAQAAQTGSAVQETRQAIYIQLPLGSASIEKIAAGIGVSARTLQRRLDADGVSFADLLDEARRELVLRYLANPANSLTQVAELLGYAQLSSFTRWFTARFGAAPTRWRAASRAG
jgi:AraC-like DNA-binding protein